MSDWDIWFISGIEYLLPVRERSSSPRTIVPPCNVFETPEKFIIQVEIPGVSKENVIVEVFENILHIHGRKVDESPDLPKKYYAFEFEYGPFERKIKLPQGLDFESITSRLENGILTIEIPKKPRKVVEVEIETHD